MSEPMIAYCGLTCTECPAYLATRTGDQAKAAEVAAMWSRDYGIKVTPDDVWCDGCLVDGKKCAHCAECEIRACAQEKAVANCAHCDEYACDTLGKFFAMVPPAKATLDGIRASLS